MTQEGEGSRGSSRTGQDQPTEGADLIPATLDLAERARLGTKIGPCRPIVGATLVVARPRFRPIFIPRCADSKAAWAIPQKITLAQPPVGVIRESPPPFSCFVVPVAADMSDSSENSPRQTGARRSGFETRPHNQRHPYRHSRVGGNPCPGHLPREDAAANLIFMTGGVGGSRHERLV